MLNFRSPFPCSICCRRKDASVEGDASKKVVPRAAPVSHFLGSLSRDRELGGGGGGRECLKASLEEET